MINKCWNSNERNGGDWFSCIFMFHSGNRSCNNNNSNYTTNVLISNANRITTKAKIPMKNDIEWTKLKALSKMCSLAYYKRPWYIIRSTFSGNKKWVMPKMIERLFTVSFYSGYFAIGRLFLCVYLSDFSQLMDWRRFNDLEKINRSSKAVKTKRTSKAVKAERQRGERSWTTCDLGNHMK